MRDSSKRRFRGEEASRRFVLDETTVESSGVDRETTLRVPTLTFLSGDALGKELPLVQSEITLGRGEEADVVLADPSVSRKHVRLTLRRVVSEALGARLKVFLQDLGSKNGTLVNYRRVARAVLKPGDKIILGSVILKFEYKDLADQRYYEELYRLATTDHLTSLHNKSSICRILTEELSKQARYPRPLSVLLLDIDDFKKLNDTLGHLVGDRVLQVVGRILHRNLRKQDHAGRFGGEEFLLVLPETGAEGAGALAERIRKDLEQSAGKEAGVAQVVTASLGLATSVGESHGGDEILQWADAALYEAKKSGKNCIVVGGAPGGA